MSTQTFTERRSWRHQAKSSRSPWVARLIVTTVLAALIGGFIYWLLPTPQPRLRPILIAGSDEMTFDTDVIMPPMYGARARKEIKATLEKLGVPTESWKSAEIWGTVDGIRDRLATNMKDALVSKHDTTMVIVRGYLMTDANGEAAIACSDLGVLPGSNAPQGLLPIKEILDPMATNAPSGFRGARIVILDVEPLGALPRLQQFGDDAIQKLDVQLRGMTAPWAEKLWVLVTRPPMQSPGWDPAAALPVSTQTLLQGLTGRGGVNESWVELRELAAFMNARYQRLDQSESLGVLVMQGGKGQIESSNELPSVRIPRALPPSDPDAGPTDDDASEEANDDDDEKAAARRNSAGGVALTRYRPNGRAVNTMPVSRYAQDPSAAVDPNAADPNAPNFPSAGGEREAATGAERDTMSDATGGDTASPVASEKASERPGNSPLQPGASTIESFWDLRDRLEGDDSNGSLHPIAVAPHLWRKLILNALHAEIESGSESPGTLIRDARTSLKQLENAVHAPVPPGDLVVPSNLVKQIFRDWQKAGRAENRRRVGELVRSADALQYAISVARSRWWSLQLFQQQAMANGCQPLAISSDWERELGSAEAVLVSQVGANADRRVMDQATDDLWKLIRGSQAKTGDSVDRLLSDFSRRRRGKQPTWKEVRLACVFLRSPLPNASQRRRLQTAISESVIDTSQQREVGEIGNQSFANVSESNLTRSVVQQVRDQHVAWQRRTRKTETNEFSATFADVLRMDPCDASALAGREPPMHIVEQAQHIPNADALMADASDVRLDQELLLSGLEDHVLVKILPDAEERTDYRLIFRLQNLATGQPLSLQWQQGPGVTNIDQQNAIVSIPAGKQGGKVRLDITSSGFADEHTSAAKLFVDIEPLSEATTPHVKELRKSVPLKIILPKRNEIQVAVRCEGLSKQSFSDDEDNFRRGVWLRTFASRETRFRLSLKNRAEHDCRAKVWMIRLRNPFPGVSAYWPELLAAELENIRESLMQANGQVRQSVLDGDQKLRGPHSVDIGGNGVLKDLDWKPADDAADEDGSSAPVAAAPNADSSAGTDVTHGMALVVRLVDKDDDDRALPGGDQIIWLLPKPWRPDQYVQLKSMRYRSGEVQIKASLKRKIDHDDRDDEIPELSRKAVSIRWQEDPAWDGFNRRDKTKELQAQVMDLSFDGVEEIEVPVESGLSESSVALDVDGWPRALRGVIDHQRDAEGRPKTAWDTVRFAAVTMFYGENPPGEEGDDPVADTILHYPDGDVAFRGGGKQLRLQLRADFSDGVYAEIAPPEIRLTEGDEDDLLKKFWSDRALQTVLKEVKDDGRISLVSAVSDLVIDRNNDASRRDAVFDYRLSLRGVRSDLAQLRVTLDSTPPSVDSVRANQRSFQVGDELQLSVMYSDARTAVKEIVVGTDMDGDGNPDGKRVSVLGTPKPYRTQFKLEQPNDELILHAQVWDQVGNRSEPKLQVVRVRAKPKPPPVANPGKPAVAAPPPKGRIKGIIKTGSTLRGDLYLVPAPSGMIPPGGLIKARSKNPEFEFSNLPPQDYTLIFDGTVQGTDKRRRAWKGLKIHNAGGQDRWELKLRDASDPDGSK